MISLSSFSKYIERLLLNSSSEYLQIFTCYIELWAGLSDIFFHFLGYLKLICVLFDDVPIKLFDLLDDLTCHNGNLFHNMEILPSDSFQDLYDDLFVKKGEFALFNFIFDKETQNH